LMATIVDTNLHPFNGVEFPANLGSTIQLAEMEIMLPDGEEEVVAMHDDGKYGDLVPNDGIYTATLPATLPGQYRARSQIWGFHVDQTPFYRTADHVFTVINTQIQLTGLAVSSNDQNSDQMEIDVFVSNINSIGTEVKAYSEVWGLDHNGAEIPICWIGGFTKVTQKSSLAYVPLELNLNWVKMAGASPPFTLRNLRLEDPESHVIISKANNIKVSFNNVNTVLVKRISAMAKVTKITEEMKMGVRPTIQAFTLLPPTIVTTHGYCSGGNPFAVNPSHFSCCNTAYFNDPNKARSNTEFAKLLGDFASSYDAITLVGHSQGGMAALTLFDGYWSALDSAQPNLPEHTIQSIGTPYQGCSGASWGGLIPGGCSVVDDLTPAGAQKWLSTISADSRSKVTFWYTKEKSKACNSLVNLILKKPNDGTTETSYASLPGGKSAPSLPFVGECHTTGMSEPPSYYNANRNSLFCSQGCPH